MSVVERALEKLRRDGGNTPQVADVPEPPVLASAPSGVPAEPQILIDRQALRAAGYLPDASQERRFADEYRHIKRKLLSATFAAPTGKRKHLPSPRLIMMASALPGDGKTFTSINLSASLAQEKEGSLVLVDGDVAKRQLSQVLGVAKRPGLLDALADPAIDVVDLILQTDRPGLSILPAGSSQDDATELLSSGRMKAVANRIIERTPRTIALFDSSPVLVTSESLALAGAVGQVVLVVRAGRTPRHAVVDAVESFSEDIPLGLVLNQGRRGLSEGRYGYGYG